MAKPENSIRKIQQINSSNPQEWEIIPHSLTDGANLAQVPPVLGEDKYVITSVNPLQIPALPQTNGEYVLKFLKNGTNISIQWVNNLVAVEYLDADGSNGKVIYSDSGVNKDVYYGVI